MDVGHHQSGGPERRLFHARQVPSVMGSPAGARSFRESALDADFEPYTVGRCGVPSSLEAAVRTHGYGCFAFDVLQRPELYQTFASSTTPGAFVTYRGVGSVDVVLGEPLAAKSSLEAVVAEFLRDRRRAGRVVLGFLASRDFALAAVSAGASAVQFAAEPELDPVTYEPRGASAKKFRVYVRRMEQRGAEVVTLPAAAQRIPAAFRLSANLLIKNWLAHGVSRRAHLVDIEPWLSSEEKRYFAVYDPHGRNHMWALLIAHPVYPLGGWHLCHLVRAPDAPEGALELAVMRAIETFRREGTRYVTLGPYGEARTGEFLNVGSMARWSVTRAYRMTARVGAYAKALGFCQKIHAERWEPRYLIFSPPRAYVRGLFAAARVSHVFDGWGRHLPSPYAAPR